MSQVPDADPLEALANLPSFHQPTVSPDGSAVALYYDGSGRNELHVIDVETGSMTQVSDGDVPRDARWFLEWTADGEGVYFHNDEQGNEQHDIYRIDLDGRVEPVITGAGQATLQDVTEDALLFGSTREGQMNLYRYDLADETTAKLTDYERAVWTGVFDPAGERIAYATNESDDFDNRDVYIAERDGSNPRNLQIGETGAEATPVEWHPDGDRLLVADNTADLSRAGEYDLAADEVTWYGDESAEVQPVTYMPDGDRILVLRTRRAAVMPVIYDTTTGEATQLDLPEGVATFGGTYVASGEQVVDDHRVIVTHTTSDRRPDLLLYDLEEHTANALLEAEYGPFDRDAFVEAEYFRFSSHDDLEIGALLYDSGVRPSPLIVKPHGGPRAADLKRFNQYTQFLLLQGLSVLEVNYRGSTGRGREFVERLIGDWGGDEQADIAAGLRHVLDTREWIDEDRIAVFGASYGGYSAFMQLLQYPELYDAGVAWIGVTDLEDMYENTMPHYRTELMEKYLGTPEEHPELYRERSPTTHVEELDAPLLIAHGKNDRRVPISQARLFRDALEDAGYVEGEDADFEYVELGEEGHASTDIDQKARTFELVADFLSRRVS